MKCASCLRTSELESCQRSETNLIHKWETLKVDNDYEICVTYPYNIRKKWNQRIIKEWEENTGYIRCCLNSKKHSKHRLIAEQWIENDDPENKTDIDHINHNRSDNHISNLRWCLKSENQRNQSSYNGVVVEYLDELPPESIKIELYKGIEFEGYYYSKETKKCYYDNGVKIRTLPYQTSAYGMRFIHAQDINHVRRCIYIDSWLKSECLE